MLLELFELGLQLGDPSVPLLELGVELAWPCEAKVIFLGAFFCGLATRDMEVLEVLPPIKALRTELLWAVVPMMGWFLAECLLVAGLGPVWRYMINPGSAICVWWLK